MNLENWMRKALKDLKPYSSARDEYQGGEEEMVFLDANENPFGNGLNRYPDPHHRSLRQELALIKRVPMDSMLLGNGSDEVLDLLFRLFCEPSRDEVLIQPPTYGMYKVLAGINDVSCREVPLDHKFQTQTDELLKAITPNTKLIFFCSPNNPTGNLIREVDIEKVLRQAPCMVVVDEAYIDFAESSSWTTRLSDYPNLVVVQTLSKAYGLAGIRLGMLMADPRVIAALNRIKPPYNVNQLTQERALERLSEGSVKQEISLLLSERERLERELIKIPMVSVVYPSDANFLLVQVDDANKRYAELIGQGLVLRNRTNQPGCTNTLRITIGTKAENDKLLDTLQKIS